MIYRTLLTAKQLSGHRSPDMLPGQSKGTRIVTGMYMAIARARDIGI